MNKEINVYDYMNEIVSGVKSASLLTTKVEGKVNSMTISWGKIGIEWNKLIFITYVREHRHTRDMLDQSGEFTINIPLNQSVNKITSYCGTKSGRNTDKIKDLGLTLVDGKAIETPGIKELALTLECKVIYQQMQDKSAVPDSIKKVFYPEGVGGEFFAANEDYHIAYYGEVVGAYIIE